MRIQKNHVVEIYFNDTAHFTAGSDGVIVVPESYYHQAIRQGFKILPELPVSPQPVFVFDETAYQSTQPPPDMTEELQAEINQPFEGTL